MNPGSSPPAQRHHSLAAIVVTDGVEFSESLVGDQGSNLTAIREDLQSLANTVCNRFGGQLFQTSDRGTLMYFTSAVQAVTCAINIQKDLTQMTVNIPPDSLVAPRIGIHLGDVVFSETDLVGEGVTIANRLLAEASPGGICISKTVYDVVKARLNLKAVFMGSIDVDASQETVQAYEIFPVISAPALGNPVPSGGAIAPETLVNNRYRVRQVLGRGGFGQTYLAHDTYRFDDLCVLKEFVPLTKTPQLVEKSRKLFEQEARVLYQINHPQIPKFLAWFTENERLLIVQEYIDGKTYSDLVRDRQVARHSFSEAEVIEWLWDLLPVLDYIHGMNIVHRDISPENIMLPNGQSKPVLIDFGVVKQVVTQIWTGQTNPASGGQASVIGKFGYAPPEQMRLGQCFPCSDLYALGITATVLLTNQKPSPVADPMSFDWRQFCNTPVSDRFGQLLDKMLAERPKDRYQTARQVIADLEPIRTSMRWPGASILGESPFESPDSLPNARPQAFNTPASRSAAPPPPPPRPPAPPPLPASPAVEPSRPPIASITPDVLAHCQRELSRYIGPMAAFLVEDVIAQNPRSTDQLIDALAREIPDSHIAEDFKRSVRLERYASPAPRQDISALEPSPPPASSPSPRRSPNNPAILNPDFIERCQQELIHCVGPVAQFIIDDLLSEDPNLSPAQLVEAIATEIPSPQQAEVFRRRLIQSM
ncbi:MAG: protein kinase domain-containing protein [Elainellaceae cyanobacterium]